MQKEDGERAVRLFADIVSVVTVMELMVSVPVGAAPVIKIQVIANRVSYK